MVSENLEFKRKIDPFLDSLRKLDGWGLTEQRMDLRREEQFESEMFMELKRFFNSRSFLELQQVRPE